MEGNMSNITIDRLHCSATYDAAKAVEIAKELTADEIDNGGTLEYRAEIKGAFGRVAAFDGGVFVGYY
jgi:hypothetical protein